MARRFTKASTEALRYTVATPNNLAGGNCTIAAVIKLAATASGNGHPILIVHNASQVWSGPGMLVDVGGHASQLMFSTDGNTKEAWSSFTLGTADNWVLTGADKASGTTTPRMHKYVYDTNTWTHQNGSTTVADGTAPSTSGTWRMAEWWGVDWADLDIAVAAVWDRQLSDTEWESLGFSLQAWIASSPVALWVLDQQAVAQSVPDHMGNSNQSARVGTTVSANSVPVWNITDGGWLVIRPQAGGAADGTLAAGVATATALSPAATLKAGATLAAGVTTATALSPAASLLAGATLAAGVTTATALSPAASLAASAVLAAGVTTATALSPAAAFLADATLAAGVTTATALAPAASIDANGSVTLGAGLVTATALSPAATLLASAVLAGNVTTATALSPAATLAAGAILAGGLTTASALSPPASLLAGATLAGAVTTATALSPAAALKASAVLGAGVGTATALSPAATFLNGAESSILAPVGALAGGRRGTLAGGRTGALNGGRKGSLTWPHS